LLPLLSLHFIECILSAPVVDRAEFLKRATQLDHYWMAVNKIQMMKSLVRRSWWFIPVGCQLSGCGER